MNLFIIFADGNINFAQLKGIDDEIKHLPDMC
jgi:hypothetical protein